MKILPSLRNAILGISSRDLSRSILEKSEKLLIIQRFDPKTVFPSQRSYIYISLPPYMTCIKRQCIEEDMGPRVWTRCSEDLKKKKSLSKSRCSCGTGMMTRCGVCDAVQNESVGASRLSPWVTSGPLLIPPHPRPDRCSRSSPTLVTYCCRGNNLKRPCPWAQQWSITISNRSSYRFSRAF